MKEERDDAQYVREFYEISEKYSTLKVFYLRNKACLRLMKVLLIQSALKALLSGQC